MLDQIFQGVFAGSTQSVISLGDFFLCVLGALVIGTAYAFLYGLRNRASHGFLVTVALLPAIVCMVILLVNGNVGAGVAVAGTFSLVRFRSVPGTAKEIGAIFIAMAAGLAAGMGYIAFSALFVLIIGLAQLLLSSMKLERDDASREKFLRVTIPEDLNYSDVFADIFEKYTATSKLLEVKTTNMGSLFRLTYQMSLRDAALEKEMIDQMRCRNGNLEICISQYCAGQFEL